MNSHDNAADDKAMLDKLQHSATGVCTLAPDRPRADVGLCRACIEQGLFDALVNNKTPEAAAERRNCSRLLPHDAHDWEVPVPGEPRLRTLHCPGLRNRAECSGTAPHGEHQFNGGMHCPGLKHPRFEPVLPAPDHDPERKAFELRPATPASSTADTDEHVLYTVQTFNNGTHREGFTTAELEDLYETIGMYLGRD